MSHIHTQAAWPSEDGRPLAPAPTCCTPLSTPLRDSLWWSCAAPWLLPLDDLLALTYEFISANASRSGLSGCLIHHGVGNLRKQSANMSLAICKVRSIPKEAGKRHHPS